MNITAVSPEFAVDLIGLVNSLKGIVRGETVSSESGKFKFKYVTLDALLDKIKENGNFALIQPIGTDEQGESALQTILVHKSGQALTSDYYKLRVPENGTKQAEGSAITYTKRYALGAFLGISTEEDDDAGSKSGREMPYGKAKTAAARPQQKQQSSEQRQSGTQPPTQSGGDTISTAQQKRMFALAEGDLETVKKVIGMMGYEKTSEIKKADYEDICTTIKSMIDELKEQAARDADYPGFDLDDIDY